MSKVERVKEESVYWLLVLKCANVYIPFASTVPMDNFSLCMFLFFRPFRKVTISLVITGYDYSN